MCIINALTIIIFINNRKFGPVQVTYQIEISFIDVALFRMQIDRLKCCRITCIALKVMSVVGSW